jgi:GT2 family glycosyltransferase
MAWGRELSHPAESHWHMLKEDPLASVVVVNWNGAAFIGECVDSLLDQSYRRVEIIVVDNGSVDDSVEVLRRRYGAEIRLITRDSNAGFAGGANEGIRASSGAWVAVINNDATADRGWLEALVRAGERDPSIGMCASRILARGEEGVIDSAGLLLSRDGIGRGRGRLERSHGAFDSEEDVLLPSACAAAYRRTMLDEIGLFDDDFFAYCEDTDLGLRGRLAGWRCRYSPLAVVHHDYSRSSAPYSDFKAFHVERNRIWVLVKCFPLRELMLAVPYSVSRYLVQAYGAIVGRGAAAKMKSSSSIWALPRTVFAAWWGASRHLGAMWARRRRIQRNRRVSPSEFRSWLDVHGVSLSELALKD